MKQSDQENFLNEIEGLRLGEKVNIIKDIGNKYRILHDRINKIINKHAPMTYMWNTEAKGNKKPWRTSAVWKSIKAKNYFLKTFLKNKDQFYYHKYKYWGEKLNDLIRVSKKQYYTNVFNKNIDNVRKMWKQINI